jgi:hypothetical protein
VPAFELLKTVLEIYLDFKNELEYVINLIEIIFYLIIKNEKLVGTTNF